MRAVPQFLCAAALALCGAVLAQAQDGVKLQYKMGKDEKLIYRKVQSIEQTQTVLDMKVQFQFTNTDVAVWSLVETDRKGNLQLQSENKSILVKAKVAKNDYTFDSKKQDNDKASQLGSALTPIYERLSGANVKVTITPHGKVMKVEGYKELIADLLKDNPFGAQFGVGNDEAIKLAYADLFPDLSEKKIRPGDIWEVPFSIEMPKLGKATGKKVYRYEGPDRLGKRQTEKISVSFEMSFDLNVEQNGAKVTGTLSITNSSGTIHFDAKKGHVVSAKSEFALGGTLNVNVNNRDIQVTTDQTQRVAVDLLDQLPK